MRESETHSTMNLYEGSFLLCKGFKLAGKKKDDRKTVVFFEGAGVRTKALEYYNGGKVEAKALMDAYRTLKDYVFEDR